MKYEELYAQSKEEIRGTVILMSPATLLQVFAHEHETFNPVDDKRCWLYELLKTEIIDRMSK